MSGFKVTNIDFEKHSLTLSNDDDKTINISDIDTGISNLFKIEAVVMNKETGKTVPQYNLHYPDVDIGKTLTNIFSEKKISQDDIVSIVSDIKFPSIVKTETMVAFTSKNNVGGGRVTCHSRVPGGNIVANGQSIKIDGPTISIDGGNVTAGIVNIDFDKPETVPDEWK